jgi:hypothetical protein
MPLLQPGQTRIGSGGPEDKGSDLYVRAPVPGGQTVIEGGVTALGGQVIVENDAGLPTVVLATLPTAATGARGQVDIFAVDNEVDDNQVAYMRLRGFTGGDVDICRADLPGGPVPFINSDGTTKDTTIGYNFAPFANVNVVGAAGTGLVYDTANHRPILKRISTGEEAFVGAGPFGTTAPDPIDAPFVAAKSTNLLIDLQLFVNVDGGTGATVGASDCVVFTVEDLTGGQGTVARACVKPFTMPVAPTGASYELHTTVVVPVTQGVSYEVRWNFLAPSGALVLGPAGQSGVQYDAYDIQPYA